MKPTKPSKVPKNPPVRARPSGDVDPNKCSFCPYKNDDARVVRTHVIRFHGFH